MPKTQKKSSQNKNQQIKSKKTIKKGSKPKKIQKQINTSMSIVFIFDCIQQSNNFRSVLIETIKQIIKYAETKDYNKFKIYFGYVQSRFYTQTGQLFPLQHYLTICAVDFIKHLEQFSKFDKEHHFETNVTSILENALNILQEQQFLLFDRNNKAIVLHFIHCLAQQEGDEFNLDRINKVTQNFNDYNVNYKIITTQDSKQGQKVRECLQDKIKNYEEILFESRDDIPKLVMDSLLK